MSIKNAFSCKYQKTQPIVASNKGQSLLDYVKSGHMAVPLLVRNTTDVRVETVVPVGATAPGMTSHNPSKGRKHMRPGSEHVNLFLFNGKEKIYIL